MLSVQTSPSIKFKSCTHTEMYDRKKKFQDLKNKKIPPASIMRYRLPGSNAWISLFECTKGCFLQYIDAASGSNAIFRHPSLIPA